MGVYQIKQVPCYTNEHLTEDGLYELLLFKEAIGIIKVKIQSRIVLLQINFQFIVHCPYFFSKYFIQIYHVWEGYLRKIPVERRKIKLTRAYVMCYRYFDFKIKLI
jgi:hypothetical protein